MKTNNNAKKAKINAAALPRVSKSPNYNLNREAKRKYHKNNNSRNEEKETVRQTGGRHIEVDVEWIYSA